MQRSRILVTVKSKAVQIPVEINPGDPEETHRMSISALSKTKMYFRCFIFQLISGGWCSTAGARRRANGRWVPLVQMGFMQRSHSNPRPKSFTRPLESSYLFGTKLPFPSLLCIHLQDTHTHSELLRQSVSQLLGLILLEITLSICRTAPAQQAPHLSLWLLDETIENTMDSGWRLRDWCHQILCTDISLLISWWCRKPKSDCNRYNRPQRLSTGSLLILSTQFHSKQGIHALSPKLLRSERICLERKCSTTSIRIITEINRSWKEFILSVLELVFVSPVKPVIWKRTRVEVMRSLLAFISGH